MRVILLSDVKKLGKKNDVVEVSDGYARNFLIARGLAVQETKTSKSILDKTKELEKENIEELRKEALALKDKIEVKEFIFKVKAGKEGKVFGSISTKQIVAKLEEEGIKIDKRKIINSEPITTLGITNVKIELFKGVIASIKCHLIEE